MIEQLKQERQNYQQMGEEIVSRINQLQGTILELNAQALRAEGVVQFLSRLLAEAAKEANGATES